LVCYDRKSISSYQGRSFLTPKRLSLPHFQSELRSGDGLMQQAYGVEFLPGELPCGRVYVEWRHRHGSSSSFRSRSYLWPFHTTPVQHCTVALRSDGHASLQVRLLCSTVDNTVSLKALKSPQQRRVTMTAVMKRPPTFGVLSPLAGLHSRISERKMRVRLVTALI
jgi:hypothetical protein